MSKPVLVVLVVECWLVMLTALLLIQPSFVFRSRSDSSRNIITGSGLFLLCLTFCWSVIFGCLLAFQQNGIFS